jgi:hypothetical protein
MSNVDTTFDAAIAESAKARARVQKVKTKQVRGIDDVDSLKATAQTWFHTHRPKLVHELPSLDVSAIDTPYTIILSATAKHAVKATYLEALADAKSALVQMRAAVLVAPSADVTPNIDEMPPDFASLAGNQKMRDILTRRWQECSKCVRANAHLAAVVMMGGLLEALFVARANKLLDKSALIGATTAPKDKSTGKTINYQDWMLDSYIKVGHELGWITESAKDFADILKEYRNFIHPAKELRYGISFDVNDASIFWQVTKALARQLLLSASATASAP